MVLQPVVDLAELEQLVMAAAPLKEQLELLVERRDILIEDRLAQEWGQAPKAWVLTAPEELVQEPLDPVGPASTETLANLATPEPPARRAPPAGVVQVILNAIWNKMLRRAGAVRLTPEPATMVVVLVSKRAT
jgi:hypothetical protein